MPKYTDEQIQRAKNVDVKEFLEKTEGYTFEGHGKFLKCQNPQRTNQPSSLSIDTSINRIYYNSVTGNRPLSAIDWCMKIQNMDFQTTMQVVLGENPQGERVQMPKYNQYKPQTKTAEEKNLVLSEKSDTTRHVSAYLTKTRGIPQNIVNDCLEKKLIYEDIRNNAVFVGYDSENKVPKYAARRGTFTPDGKEPFKRDCTGSDKRFAFRLEGNSTDTIYVAEAAIDVLSLATLEDKFNGTGAYKEKTYISTGGAGIDNAVEQFCNTHKVKTINICFDNDEAGKNGMEKTMEKFREKGYIVNDMRAKFAHDYNDELVSFNNDPNFYSKPPDAVKNTEQDSEIIDDELDEEPRSLDELMYYASQLEDEDYVPFDDYYIPDEHYENRYSDYRKDKEEPMNFENTATPQTEDKRMAEIPADNTSPPISDITTTEPEEKAIKPDVSIQSEGQPKAAIRHETVTAAMNQAEPEKTVTTHLNITPPIPDKPMIKPEKKPIRPDVQSEERHKSIASDISADKKITEKPKEPVRSENKSVIFGNVPFSKISEKQQLNNISAESAPFLFARLQQENIGFSGKFTENGLTVICSQKDISKVKNILLEEKTISNIQKEPENTVKLQKEMPKASLTTAVSENELFNMSDSQKTNTLLGAIRNRQETKRADLLDRIDKADGKIALRQDKIAKLENKISDIEMSIKTSEAFKRVFRNTPIAALIEKKIEKKRVKIAVIRKDKIPKQQEKIQLQNNKKNRLKSKLGKVNHKIDKIDKLQNFISAISSKDKMIRHKGFVTGLNELSDIHRQRLENKLEKKYNAIDMLSARISSPELSNSERLEINRNIQNLKFKAEKISDKISSVVKLNKDLADMQNGRYTEKEIDTAIENTVDKMYQVNDKGGIVNNLISQTVESGSEAISKVAEKNHIRSNDILRPTITHERTPSDREPDVNENAEQKIILAVASITGIPTAELNRLPVEVKSDIISEFKENNGNMSSEKLTERICNIADIEPPKQDKISESTVSKSIKKEKTVKDFDNPLFSRSVIMSEAYTPKSSKTQDDKTRDEHKKDFDQSI